MQTFELPNYYDPEPPLQQVPGSLRYRVPFRGRVYHFFECRGIELVAADR